MMFFDISMDEPSSSPTTPVEAVHWHERGEVFLICCFEPPLWDVLRRRVWVVPLEWLLLMMMRGFLWNWWRGSVLFLLIYRGNGRKT